MTYFSDFDSRHYLKRRISEDLVEELSDSLKYRPEPIVTLILLLPPSKRTSQAEQEISASITGQFRLRLDAIRLRARSTRKRGLIMLVAGVVIMVADSVIAYKAGVGYLSMLLRIFLEPAGWFTIWTGLELLIDKYRSIMKEGTFYERLSGLAVCFKDA